MCWTFVGFSIYETFLVSARAFDPFLCKSGLSIVSLCLNDFLCPCLWEMCFGVCSCFCHCPSFNFSLRSKEENAPNGPDQITEKTKRTSCALFCFVRTQVSVKVKCYRILRQEMHTLGPLALSPPEDPPPEVSSCCLCSSGHFKHHLIQRSVNKMLNFEKEQAINHLSGLVG